MKNFLQIYIIITITLSCQRQEKPKNLIPEKKMEAILTDMIMTQSFSTHYQGLLSIEQMDSITHWIVSKHKTDTATFNASYHYYIDHPEQLDSMLSDIARKVEKMPTVKDTLVPIQERVNKLPPKQRLEQLRKQLPEIVEMPR
jgi:hypothetical protein